MAYFTPTALSSNSKMAVKKDRSQCSPPHAQVSCSSCANLVVSRLGVEVWHLMHWCTAPWQSYAIITVVRHVASSRVGVLRRKDARRVHPAVHQHDAVAAAGHGCSRQRLSRQAPRPHVCRQGIYRHAACSLRCIGLSHIHA